MSARRAASQQQYVMHEMKTQRRREIAGREEGPLLGGRRRRTTARDAGGRRQSGLSRRFVRFQLCGTEINARAPLTFVQAVMPVVFRTSGAVAIHMTVLATVRRLDRWRRAALPRTGVGMVPATAQHRVQGQQRGRQVGKKTVHRSKHYMRSVGARQRCRRLPSNKFPSMATLAQRRSRTASM